MLVLARRKNQSIIVNNNIEIFIIDIANEQVKIGVKAPKDISVYRKEIYEAINQEMKEAGNSKISELEKFKNKNT